MKEEKRVMTVRTVFHCLLLLFSRQQSANERHLFVIRH